MDRFDSVEKLREKAQVSYQEAREALEKSDWDLTEAMILLEREGRLEGAAAKVKPQDGAKKNVEKKPVRKHTESLGNLFEVLADFISKLAQKGNRNHLEVVRDKELMFKVPLTVLVLLMIIGFWVLVPTMLIAWFAGIRYRFTGKDIAGIANKDSADEKE